MLTSGDGDGSDGADISGGDGTPSCYIGHTTKTLDERFEGHQREYKDTKKASGAPAARFSNARMPGFS